jgi:hypothetical protein
LELKTIFSVLEKDGRTAAGFGKKSAWTCHLPHQKHQLQKFYRYRKYPGYLFCLEIILNCCCSKLVTVLRFDGQNVKNLDVKTGGMKSNQWDLMDKHFYCVHKV